MKTKTFTPQQIFGEMKSTGIVPLFTHDDPVVALQVLTTAYEAGIRVFEFTNRKKNSFSVFTELLKHRHQFQDLKLGIGTVMDADTTLAFIEAGADFIISPVMKPEMAEVCRKHDIPWIPGCATLTEIVNARDHGAEVIKVFPGSVLGPRFVSSIMPVVPDLQLMITGGVEPTEKNLSEWFRAGAMCVGMGSQLFTAEILEGRHWNLLKQKISEALNLVQKIKNNS